MTLESAAVIGSIIIGGLVVKFFKAIRTRPRRAEYGWFAPGTDETGDGFSSLKEAVDDAERRLSE